MRVYLDTGPLIDYLSRRGMASLRTAGRRRRSLVDIQNDADQVLHRIKSAHNGYMSTLTYYEIEEALLKSLSVATVGVPYASTLLIPAARASTVQTVAAARLFNIVALDLTPGIVDAQLREVELQVRGIRSADALHLTTAMSASADVFISTDAALIALDGILRNNAGHAMRICDTDIALTLL